MVLEKVLRPAVGLLCVVSVVAACGGQSAPPSAAPSSSSTPAPKVASDIDARWMALGSPNWRVLNHVIARDRQIFQAQPTDETFEFPNERLGSNHPAATAQLTVYAPGAYDPSAIYTGQPVTVNGGEGFFLPPRWPAGATLAWQYDGKLKGAWVTAHGRSKTAAELSRLLELAAQVRPAERSPVRFPLSLSSLPTDMPLIRAANLGQSKSTSLSFGGCGVGPLPALVDPCAAASELQIRLDGDFPEHRMRSGQRQEVYTVPVSIGGRQGYLHEDDNNKAAIEVAPGNVVTFAFSGPSGTAPPAIRFEDILANVTWTSDPADEATWPAITDWVN